MRSFLRSALGLKHRGHLAVEELTGEEAAPAAEDTVVMKGPLADVFSDALDAVYDKSKPAPTEGEGTNPDGTGTGEPAVPVAPIEGAGSGDPAAEPATPAGEPSTDPAAPAEPSTETGINVDPAAIVPAPGTELEPTEMEKAVPEITQIVLESQAIDSAVVQALAAAATDAEPDDGNYTTLYAIDESQVQPENVVEVTQILAEAEKPENVAVLIEDVMPTEPGAVEPTAEQTEAQEKLIVGLESMVVAMGGKVYRKFGDYVASRRK